MVLFCPNSFFKIISNYMLLAYFSSYLTKHSTYGLAKNVSFDLNIVAKIKI